MRRANAKPPAWTPGASMPARVAALLLAVWSGSAAAAPWKPCAQLKAPALQEVSGIVASRRRPGVFWVLNDSGDRSRLFAIDRQGALLSEVRVAGAKNVDWEDLTTDADGYLYIGDFGNNDNNRKDLTIYVIEEPDPRDPADSVVTVLRRIPFFFPEQHRFPDPEEMNYDCEALFWDNGQLFVLTKHRSDTRTALYRIPLEGIAQRAAERIADYDIGSMATAASVSPDGRYLAVLSYQYIHVFDRPERGDNWLGGTCHRLLIEGRQCEGITFDRERILFTNEQREIYCLDLADVLRGERYLPEPPRLGLPRVEPGLDAQLAESPAAALVPLQAEPTTAGGWTLGTPPEARPTARLGWCPDGVLLQVVWPLGEGTKVAHAENDHPLLQLMLGPPGATVPRLEPGQRVWEARSVRDSVELRPVLPQPGPALERVRVQRSPRELVLEALVPVSAGELHAGQALGLDLILFAPDDPDWEWAWAGSSSTQPLENPLLWGRAGLEP
jgi:hypothetical protein